MESVNNSKASIKEMQDQFSRQRRKLTFIIPFVVLFLLIFGSIITVFAMLKHNTQAEELSAKIQSVCSLTPHHRSCSKSIRDNQIIYPSETINPSKIFNLSLHSAIEQLNDLISTTQTIISETKNSTTLTALRECESLFKDSMGLLKKITEVMDVQTDPDEDIFKENKSIIRNLQAWMKHATENFDRCLSRTEDNPSKDYNEVRMMKMKMEFFSRPSMENSLMILVKMDEILELFDPRFGSVLVNLLLSTRGYVFSVGVFCSQYLVLVILLVMLLRLH